MSPNSAAWLKAYAHAEALPAIDCVTACDVVLIAYRAHGPGRQRSDMRRAAFSNARCVCRKGIGRDACRAGMRTACGWGE